MAAGPVGVGAMSYWGVLITLGNVVLAVVGILLLNRARARAVEEVTRGLLNLGKGKESKTILREPSGAPAALVQAFNRVIPELEDRIMRLENDRRLLGAVLGGMNEGVLAVDARQRLLFANMAAGKMFGVGDGAVGRLVVEVIRSPEVHRAVEATLSSSAPYSTEIMVPAGSESGAILGSSLMLEVQGTVLSGTPPAGAVLVFHDITEKRRLERVRQDFVANASHELKTPLASIKAYTETLMDWALHDENVNVKFLERIDEQAERLNQLILDLLSIARLESGDEFYQHSPLFLVPVVEKAVEAHRGRAEALGLTYNFRVGLGAEQVVVTADEEAIRQVLDNLIDNAIKYTSEGGKVGVGLSLSFPDGVLIEVKDSGIGIPRDVLPRVFERFYRVDKARSRELGGTGLGLSIVKHLVQSLGGQVSVDSTLGAGSTFSVRLPRARAGANREDAAPIEPVAGWAGS